MDAERGGIMSPAQRCLSMVKGQHRFVFRYAEGAEAELLASFIGLARDPESEFDFFDAAVLSFQMGHLLTDELDPVARLE